MHGLSPAEMDKYRPRYNFPTELNIGDQWRGQWVDEDELPDNAPVVFAYAIVMGKDRGYLTRSAEDEPWSTVEVPMEAGDDPAKTVQEAIHYQMGVKPGPLFLVGFFECRGTRHNTEFGEGAITVRPLYLAVAKDVEDVPDESPHQRRRQPLNEFNLTLRRRYPEITKYVNKAVQLYLVKQSRGEI